MDKTKILLLLLVAVLLFALFYQKSNYSEKETTSNLMVYKNPDYNYSLSYSEGVNEFFRNEGLLGKESVIELGGYFKKSEKAQYQKDLEVVKNVLSTLNKI